MQEGIDIRNTIAKLVGIIGLLIMIVLVFGPSLLIISTLSTFDTLTRKDGGFFQSSSALDSFSV